jgi:nicotinate dehydrogenase subunit B
MKQEDIAVYPEQYELYEQPMRTPLSRRSFIRLMGGGVGVALTISDVLAATVSGQFNEYEQQVDNDTLAAWIHINEDGKIIVYTGKVEVGQNIRTSLTQIVAEELRVSVDAIEMIMGDTSLTPYDRGTFGSLTTPNMSPILRRAAASLREVLTEMAATEWKAKATALVVENGKITNPATKKSFRYNELTKGTKILKPVDPNAPLTPPDKWKVAGKSIPKINGRSFITGKHQYASDITLPGMVYGKILRAPAYGASLVSVNTEKAKTIPGVTVVQDEDFVGVTAPDSQQAESALWEIKAEWKTTPQPSRDGIFKYLKEKAQSPRTESNQGNVDQVFSQARNVLTQTFQIDYIAHVPLEPRASVAHWEGDKLTVWIGTQRPFGVQEQLEQHFRINKDNVRVIMPDTGSGYGGKHTGEVALEAARLAKAAGKPVKVVWTREEEFKWAYFRPAGVMEVKSVASTEGIVKAWEFHNYNSGSAGIRTPYAVEHQKIQFHPVDSPLRQGSYRVLAATANVFARESQMNDMAVALKMDPVEFRLENLSDQRLQHVVEATAKAFGWSKPKAKNRGYGFACGFEKGGYTALAVEVEVSSSGEVSVLRIVSAFECGKIINPRHLRSQVLGGILQGLGGALFETVDFKDGKIVNPSLTNYRVPRFNDIPELDIILIDKPEIPSTGAGEAPIVGVAPAIRNAIFDATGKKLNNLPLIPNGLKMS